MVKAVIITEGDIHMVKEFESSRDARQFSAGFSEGAGAYGGGSWAIITADDFESQLDDRFSEELIEQIKAKLQE